MKRLPPIHQKTIGHRGLAGFAPENTLASFETAKNFGLNWVEFDVQVCGSGEWVVLHDETVDRTTNGNGQVADLPFDRLKLLDAGSHFDPKFHTERIPLLADVLLYLKEAKIHPNIEIKSTKSRTDPRIESRTEFRTESRIKSGTQSEIKFRTDSGNSHLTRHLDAFLQIIDENWIRTARANAHSSRLHIPPLISSFELEPLIMLREKAPDLPIGYLVEQWDEKVLETIQENHFQSLHCDYKGITSEQILQSKECGIEVLLYTVNERNVADSLLAKGSFAVFSDSLFVK